ncbi:DNA alkylation repair protein [Marinilabilia salmonicolor]|uniref:DNA alkylation repair protein n=1 Tax=Marinilabilia salmonicolor TaxID=989 RepID=UPI00029B4E10|nr:DNA alkylation repair protein [Marinilabilia salmonicolor]
MKFFTVEPEVDRQIESLMRRVRNLKDGETADLMKESGARYRVNYGVSVVYLRKMAGDFPKSAALAIRLWAREIRETMILATMLVDFDALPVKELEEWGNMLHTIELSEQIGRNLLAAEKVPSLFLIEWLKSEQIYKKYAAAMGIGWRIRLAGDDSFSELPDLMDMLKSMASDPRLMRAVGFVLKMAGRFSSFRDFVFENAKKWMTEDDVYVSETGKDVAYELEAFQ